jgi:hypothetical protein
LLAELHVSRRRPKVRLVVFIVLYLMAVGATLECVSLFRGSAWTYLVD